MHSFSGDSLMHLTNKVTHRATTLVKAQNTSNTPESSHSPFPGNSQSLPPGTHSWSLLSWLKESVSFTSSGNWGLCDLGLPSLPAARHSLAGKHLFQWPFECLCSSLWASPLSRLSSGRDTCWKAAERYCGPVAGAPVFSDGQVWPPKHAWSGFRGAELQNLAGCLHP